MMDVGDANLQATQSLLPPVQEEEQKDEKDLTDKVDRDEYGIWRYKGSITIETEKGGKMQFLMGELPNDYEYKFTVCAVNGKGVSTESPYSNPVMVEAPLPAGWNRFLDEKKKKFYYANLKLNRSMYGRPDHDAYFLDESILLKFNKDEISYLKALYDEEMLHFNAVVVDRFVDVLYECGEKWNKNRCLRLYKGYAKDSYKFTSWQTFMDLFFHVKRTKEQGSLMAQLNKAANIGIALKRAAAGSMLSANDQQRWGNWSTEYSAIASRDYYLNKVTKQRSWDLPDDVRFFLPPGLEKKLLKIFDYGHIETFKQYYSMLDVDNSGDLSDKEIERLLEAMGVSITALGLQRLIDVVDGNGNGTIEFDEFCWMMYEMSRTDSDSAFADFNFKLPVMTSTEGGGQEGAGEGGGRPVSAGLDFTSISNSLVQKTYGTNGTGADAGGNRKPTPREDITMNEMGFMQPKAPRTPSTRGTDRGGLTGTELGVLDSTIHSPLKHKPHYHEYDNSNGSNGNNGNTSSTVVPIAPDGTPLSEINDDLETRSNASQRSKSSKRSHKSGKSHRSKNSQKSSRSRDHESVKNKHGSHHSHGSHEDRLVGVLGEAGVVVDKEGSRRSIRSSQQQQENLNGNNASPTSLSMRSMSPEQAAKMSTAFGNMNNEVTAIADDSFGDMEYDLRGFKDEEEYDSDGNVIIVEDEPECPVCGLSQTHIQCKVCYAVGYCSRACLKDHLPTHRLVCVEISKEDYEAKQQAAKDLEHAAIEKRKVKEGLRLEAEEEKRIDAMYDEYEDEGGVVLGPNEFIDPLTNEPAMKRKNLLERVNYSIWKYFFRAKAVEKEEKDKIVQDRINKRRVRQKLDRDGLAHRDANSKHGAYCFCGCRAFR